ncbi:hypothetical protein ACLQ20_24790 [Micromonospora sp. DT46]|uniref:hypothetical protein n=1 Tax=unclassified Micromonospora TaxID=2617518 RepID=UPI002E0F63CD|nr:hypothetical protein OG989_19070 [Micromonospora sp. NBC_01740]
MAEVRARFRAAYGAGARHLLLLAGCFAVTGWVVLRVAGEPGSGPLLLWFVSAVIAHDLVLFPVYALADRGLRSRSAMPASGPSLLNHLRVPALAAGLLFLVYLPGILRQGRETYAAATGQDQQPFLARWLLLSATLFLASGILYALRRAARSRAAPGSGERPLPVAD